ncbi:MAG: ribokinase [Pseudomonadota bacterium]
MTVFCVGSINADYFYDVARIPAPGETLAANAMRQGLGGKGANQSVAAARAGARVVHIGAVGEDGAWAVARLTALGVETRHIRTVDAPTAHAIITVAKDGENAIVIFSGANLLQSEAAIQEALQEAVPGDCLILQNETSHQIEAAKLASKAGLEVIYSAAPFDVDAVTAVLPFVDILVVNELEAQQLETALGVVVSDVPVEAVIVTRGASGADYVSNTGVIHADAPKVTAVDTTGAGDTFLGYFVGARDQGFEVTSALGLAVKAAALKVTRPGTADAIPSRADLDRFAASQPRT